ncbi:hypothetical protein HG531_003187 [Fusarium graminearum]|nr:hypothetical protein HG531_003187 [Fusarium graminearum]
MRVAFSYQSSSRQTRRLEVIVKGEVAPVLALWCLLFILLVGAVKNTGLLVVSNALLEEVGLAAKGDVLHEVERVGGLVHLLVAESNEETISDEFDVLLHEVGVHAEQGTRESLSKKLLLNRNGIGDNVLDHLFAGTSLEVRVEETGKVGVKTLITRNELVRKAQTRHEATLLEPEDGSKGTAEEDTLNGSKSNKTLSEGRVLILDPSDGPIRLLSDARNSVNGVEEVCTLGRVLDVGIDEEGVCFGVDVLHHDLETIEASSLGDLDLAAESLNKILIDDAVGGSEESKNVGDEVLLV